MAPPHGPQVAGSAKDKPQVSNKVIQAMWRNQRNPAKGVRKAKRKPAAAIQNNHPKIATPKPLTTKVCPIAAPIFPKVLDTVTLSSVNTDQKDPVK